jgi:hypothetical protein
MARDPVSIASKAARVVGGPKAARTVMKNSKSVRRWVEGLGNEAKRQFKALIDSPTAGQKQIANAGSKTRAATVKARNAFAGGYGMSELVDALFGDSEQKSSAQLEKKLNSVYNKASRKDPYGGGVDALTQKALSKSKEAKEAKEAKETKETKETKKGMSRFEKEFDSARKDGKKTFEFKNKKGETGTYTTELKKNNKGGYMKKSRTGSMDYRKGGLFR